MTAHTLMFILVCMAAIRRTISLPPAVAERIEAEAKRRRTSFSAIVTELVTREPAPLPYAALFDDDDDLSLKVAEVLARLHR